MDTSSHSDVAREMGARTGYRLRVLGSFALLQDGEEIAVPALRSHALLAFLACHAGEPQSRDRLVALLWGERFDTQARQSLRQLLTVLRRILGDALAADRDTVSLSSACSSDVAEFEALIARGGDGLRDAVDLYRGDLLTAFPLEERGFAEWLETERSRLRNLAVSAMETLAERADPAQCLDYAIRALALDPFREAAHRALMRALALSGRRNDALRHYRDLEENLRQELGVVPELQTRMVFETIRGDGDGAPAAVHKPAIAVLPFEPIGGGEADARIADGITEDIIIDLARFRGLDVIARNSTANYRGQPIDPHRVGRELVVDYVLNGTIQHRDGAVRVSAQLFDAAGTSTIWSDRWDRPDRDIFAVQAEVAEAVAATLGGMGGSAAITAEEIRRARRRPPESLTAYHHYLLANAGRTVFTRESITAGLASADRAIALEPNLGRAYVARAWLNFIMVHHGRSYAGALEAMGADATHAVTLDPYDAEARVALAFYFNCGGRFEEAEAQIKTALQANPANAQVLVVAAAMRAGYGNVDEAAAMADKVLRLDPWMTSENLNCIKDAYFFARRFNDVVAVVSRIPLDSRGLGARLELALSQSLLGRSHDADRARGELLAKYPDVSAELLINRDWHLAAAQEALFIEGFRAAGLPIHARDADLAAIPHPRRLSRA